MVLTSCLTEEQCLGFIRATQEVFADSALALYCCFIFVLKKVSTRQSWLVTNAAKKPAGLRSSIFKI